MVACRKILLSYPRCEKTEVKVICQGLGSNLSLAWKGKIKAKPNPLGPRVVQAGPELLTCVCYGLSSIANPGASHQVKMGHQVQTVVPQESSVAVA